MSHDLRNNYIKIYYILFRVTSEISNFVEPLFTVRRKKNLITGSDGSKHIPNSHMSDLAQISGTDCDKVRMISPSLLLCVLPNSFSHAAN